MCGYCTRAIRLLESKSIAYEEIDVSMSSELRDSMRSRSGGRNSVPQIFIDNDHIGGCRELYALDNAGYLDKLVPA